MMWSKAKAGIVLSAITAAVVSVGSLGSVFAAEAGQTNSDAGKVTKEHKIAWGDFKGKKGHHGGEAFGKWDNQELLALLKLDEAGLKEQLKAGKSLAEIAVAQGVSTSDVTQLLTKQREQQLDEALKAGKITEEQATKAREHIAESVKRAVEGKFDGKRGEGKRFMIAENTELLTLLKLDADGLKAKIKEGKSLGEIASEQGVSTDALVALLTKQREQHLAEAVKEGKLTQEQADKLSANLADSVKRMVEGKFPDKEGFGGKHFAKWNNAELLSLLKLDEAGLKEQLKAGKSLAEIAQAQGVSTDALIQLLTKQREQRLEEAVKAGKLTREQADQYKEKLADSVKKMVEHKRTEKPKDSKVEKQEE